MSGEEIPHEEKDEIAVVPLCNIITIFVLLKAKGKEAYAYNRYTPLWKVDMRENNKCTRCY